MLRSYSGSAIRRHPQINNAMLDLAALMSIKSCWNKSPARGVKRSSRPAGTWARRPGLAHIARIN